MKILVLCGQYVKYEKQLNKNFNTYMELIDNGKRSCA